mgnify:CR=1 FL=1
MANDRRRQRGLTIIELIVFIVVVSVGIAGIMSVFNLTVRHSADPLVRKQAIAIAEALMEEVALQPFTYCDPSDDHLTTATSAAVGAGLGQCATLAESIGPEAGETRYTDPRFNSVNDYAGFDTNVTIGVPDGLTGIHDLTGAQVTALAGYRAQVTVSNAGLAFNAVNGTAYADGEVLRIDITVSRGGDAVTLSSYRFRYAPNAS